MHIAVLPQANLSALSPLYIVMPTAPLTLLSDSALNATQRGISSQLAMEFSIRTARSNNQIISKASSNLTTRLYKLLRPNTNLCSHLLEGRGTTYVYSFAQHTEASIVGLLLVSSCCYQANWFVIKSVSVEPYTLRDSLVNIYASITCCSTCFTSGRQLKILQVLYFRQSAEGVQDIFPLTAHCPKKGLSCMAYWQICYCLIY